MGTCEICQRQATILQLATDWQLTIIGSAMATTTTEEPAVKAEDVLGQKFDKCLVDTSIKVGTGLVVGSVFSLLLFKRRMWPVTFGLGTGFGMGYANCQNDINSKK